MNRSKLKVSSIIILVLIVLLQVGNAQLQIAIDQVVNHPDLKHGIWSLFVININTGDTIADVNSDKSLSPASNLKLLTSAVALDLLGENAVFHTYLEHDGNINAKGELIGNLYIRGGGDPTLGSPEMDGVPNLDSVMILWTNEIKKHNIAKITGNIIADDSYLDDMPLPGGWSWDDMGNYYAAGTSGLCINENLYSLYFKPAKSVGSPATVLRTEPAIPDIKFINHMKTGEKGSGDNGYIYGAPWQWTHQLEGTIPAGVNEFSIKGALPDPAKFAACYLKKNLENAGITVAGSALTIREMKTNYSKRNILFTQTSPPLKNIVYRLNKRSINLYAEQLLKLLGKNIKNNGSLDTGIDVIKEWLEQNHISDDGLFLLDGSGLSRANGVTTRFFVDLLRTMGNKPAFVSFYNSFPVAGDPNDSGNMKRFGLGTSAAKNVRAKTGSHDRVRALSGYLHSKSGDLICFSMMSNNYSGSFRTINKLHEKVLIALAKIQ